MFFAVCHGCSPPLANRGPSLPANPSRPEICSVCKVMTFVEIEMITKKNLLAYEKKNYVFSLNEVKNLFCSENFLN